MEKLKDKNNYLDYAPGPSPVLRITLECPYFRILQTPIQRIFVKFAVSVIVKKKKVIFIESAISDRSKEKDKSQIIKEQSKKEVKKILIEIKKIMYWKKYRR